MRRAPDAGAGERRVVGGNRAPAPRSLERVGVQGWQPWPARPPLEQRNEVVFCSRGHGGFDALLRLGQPAAVQHAPCPVVIVCTTSAADAPKEQPWTSA
jgi:hypothetical protein